MINWSAGRSTPQCSWACKFSASQVACLMLVCQCPQQSDQLNLCLCVYRCPQFSLSPCFSVTYVNLSLTPSVCIPFFLLLSISISLSLHFCFSLYLSLSLFLCVCVSFSVSLSLNVSLIHELFFNPIDTPTTIYFLQIYIWNSRFLNVESTDVPRSSGTPEAECNFLPINIFQEKSSELSTKLPKEFLPLRQKKSLIINVVFTFNKL